MKKIIILSTLMLLIVLCIPVTSATIGKYVNEGATVFVGEDGLDISEATNGVNDIGWWSSGADITRTSPDKRLQITNRKTSFSVTPAEFSSALGNWYKLDVNGRPIGGIAFNVIDPYLDLQIWNSDTDSSVYNNKVSSGTKIKFRVDSNLYAVNSKRYDSPSPTHTPLSTSNGFVNIIVKSPSGATYTKLIGYDTSLQNIFVNSPNQFWNGIWVTNELNENNIKAYPNGIYTIYAETNLNHIKDNYKQNGADYTGKTISSIKYLTITESSVSISSTKDSVIRGNPFTITITGNPLTKYYLWVTKTHDLTDKTPPSIQLYQEGVENGNGGNHITSLGYTIDSDVFPSPSPNPYYAIITTDESGIRTVGLSTSTNTSSQKFTIRVESEDQSKYDEVEVEVGSGGLTITSNGDQTYYLGEKIKFEGINTETSNVYLFMYGPNLPSDGAQMSNASLDPRHYSVINNDPKTFKQIDVRGDGTWSWDWSTSSVAIDSGTYVIFAASEPKSRTHLMDTTYATTSIKLNKPTLTVTIPQIVAKGDPITIKGFAEGQPSKGVAIWIMGTNYAKRITSSVYSDSSFSYDLTGAMTRDMSAGQYFVIVQHPMQNGQFDIVLNSDETTVSNLQLGNGSDGTQIFTFGGSGSLQGSDAANALVKAIEDPNVDDMYTKAYFTIGNPIITIDRIGDKYTGDQFYITGQTNLNIDTKLTIDAISSTFTPTNKSESGEFSGASVITNVITDNNNTGYNKFAVLIDTSTFKPDEYIVTVSAIGNDVTATTSFLVKIGPRPVTERATVQTVAIAPTPIPTTISVNATAAPTPTKTSLIPGVPGLPGFTSILAILGLLITIIFIRRK
jgi:trimeric autotransporter adhesin